MAERYVRMNILSSGAEKAKATLDDLAMRARKLGAESPNLKITADDTSATRKIKDLQLKIQILNRERAEIAFETRGDEAVKAKLLDISSKLHKLDALVAKPDVKLDAENVEAKLIRIKLLLDSLHNKHVDVSLGSRGELGRLGRLFLGGGGGPGGGGSSVLSAIGGANNSIAGGAIGTLIGLLAALSPALIPLGIGGLVGGGAAIGGLKMGSTARAQLLALEKQLHNVTGNTKSSQAARSRIQAEITAYRNSHATQLALGSAGAGLTSSLTSTFLSALTSNVTAGAGGLGHRTAGSVPGTSFLSGLAGILKQISGFVKSIGPGLGEMFRASLPFLSAFAKIFEQLAQALMPAFTQSMKQLTPFLPQIVQGFKFLSEGVADFIKDLGPGMKDSVIIFKAVMMAVKGILIGVAYTMDFLAKDLVKIAEGVKMFAHRVHQNWDQLRHDTAVIFDKIRHEIAHVWDVIDHDTLGHVRTMNKDVSRWLANMRHTIANIFDGIRHDIAHWWDVAWSETIGRLVRGVKDVGHWFTTMKGNVKSILSGLPGDLFRIGADIIGHLLSGLRSAAGPLISFVNWIKGLVGSITGFFGLGGGGGPIPSAGPGSSPHGAPRHFAMGGWIHEPVIGLGLTSGIRYTIAENEPEYVSPAGRMASGGGGNVYNIYVSGDSDPDGAALRIIQKVRDYKRHHGNFPTGIG